MIIQYGSRLLQKLQKLINCQLQLKDFKLMDSLRDKNLLENLVIQKKHHG